MLINLLRYLSDRIDHISMDINLCFFNLSIIETHGIYISFRNLTVLFICLFILLPERTCGSSKKNTILF